MNLFSVAILAGGLATRLRPITENIPKSLIHVAGKPFIFHQLDYLRNQGIRRVVLCTGYLGELIQEEVGSGSRWGIDIFYSKDGPSLLGTGGAIRNAIPLLGDKFFVLYGDSYLPINFESVQNTFSKSGKPGLMTVLNNDNKWDTSNVIYSNGKIILYDKNKYTNGMSYIDYGLGILSSDAFSIYSLNKIFDLADLYNRLSMTDQLAGYEVYNRFYEVGSHSGIAETESYLQGDIIK